LTRGSIQKVENLGQARIIEEKRKMDPPIKSEDDEGFKAVGEEKMDPESSSG